MTRSANIACESTLKHHNSWNASFTIAADQRIRTHHLKPILSVLMIASKAWDIQDRKELRLLHKISTRIYTVYRQLVLLGKAVWVGSLISLHIFVIILSSSQLALSKCDRDFRCLPCDSFEDQWDIESKVSTASVDFVEAHRCGALLK